MSGRFALFGLWLPGDSFWHRLGTGWKFLAALALTMPALIWQHPLATLTALLAAAGCLAATRLPVRPVFALPRALGVLVAILGAFQLLLGQPGMAAVVAGNVVLAVHAARLITLTTPASELVDAVVRAAARIPFVNAERLGLALGVMVRSVPYLLGAFADVTEAARARGLERRLGARLTPVVVRAVGFAQATGEALDARGLGQPASRMGP